jgi:hypothetical protein
MLFKSYTSKIIEKVFLLTVFTFYLYNENSIFTHWSYALDHDITMIYNSLLLSSNLNQEFVDHPAYSTMFVLSFFYQVAYLLNISEIKNITDLIDSSNKNDVLQNLYNISLVIHLIYAFLFLFLLNKIINSFIKDNLSSFIIICIVLFSPAFIHLFNLLRSEILSILFCFFYYICLERFIHSRSINLVFSGVFFTLAILAKVQIIFCILGFLLIFLLKNLDKGQLINFFSINFYKNIFISLNIKIVIMNVSFAFFIIYFCYNYFYKIIDGIFFIAIFLSHFFVLSYFTKKKQFFTTPIILFGLGCFLIIFFLKHLPLLGISNSFHPEIIKIIANPISQSANISSGYQFHQVDNVDFIVKLADFIKNIPGTSHGKQAQLNIIFNKLSIITYILSAITILIFIYKKKKNYISIILFLNLIITSINLVSSIRPYQQYLIYSFPFNLILISIIFKSSSYKKYFSILVLLLYLFIDFPNIKDSLDERRLDDGNMHAICTEDYLNNKDTFMRIWHRKFDKKFLTELCDDFQS